MLLWGNLFSQQYALYANGSKTKRVFKTKEECEKRIKEIMSDIKSGRKMPTELSSPDGSFNVSVSRQDANSIRAQIIKARNNAYKCECKEIEDLPEDPKEGPDGKSVGDKSFNVIVGGIGHLNDELENKDSQSETTNRLDNVRGQPNTNMDKGDEYKEIIKQEEKKRPTSPSK
jgi:hypothetical protein